MAPLSLLAIAVEYAQSEMLRTAWEQAVAHGAAGFLGVLAPRAGPHLTVDPLGALVSALIAGVAVLWLATVVIPERPRVQAALLALGVTAAVVLPTGLFVAVGSATAGSGGPMRGQDPWLGEVAYPDGAPVLDESHPPRVREAWSSSFRQEPPAALAPDDGRMPVAALMGRSLAVMGLRDPRPILVAALLLAGGLAVLAHRPWWPLALAVTLLSPALAPDLALGAPDALVLAAVLAALAFAIRGRPLPAGVTGGLAAMTQTYAMTSPIVLDARALRRGDASVSSSSRHGRRRSCSAWRRSFS